MTVAGRFAACRACREPRAVGRPRSWASLVAIRMMLFPDVTDARLLEDGVEPFPRARFRG